jgi:3-deoxy-manno-octulosonate cytidylyltransferase (CMP-KDO synthetase)
MRRQVTIIPARFASTRFPGKPLHSILGKPLIRWTWESTQPSEDVYVATDDERIKAACEEFGAKVVMTPECANGTERCALAAQALGLDPGDVVVNLQGDALLTPPEFVASLRNTFLEFVDECAAMTLVRRRALRDEPDAVSVVCNTLGEVLYFSRQAIPAATSARLYHLGVYAYTVDALGKYVDRHAAALEISERLEQLRWLAYGFKVRALVCYPGRPLPECNSPADIPAIERELRRRGSV